MIGRHHIYDDEVNPVMKVIHYRLSILFENDDLEDETSALFKILWRFDLHRTGPPRYPEFNRESVEKTVYAGHSSLARAGVCLFPLSHSKIIAHYTCSDV